MTIVALGQGFKAEQRVAAPFQWQPKRIKLLQQCPAVLQQFDRRTGQPIADGCAFATEPPETACCSGKQASRTKRAVHQIP